MAALLLFGALLTPKLFGPCAVDRMGVRLARPAALAVSFIGAKLSWREQVAAMWFRPRALSPSSMAFSSSS